MMRAYEIALTIPDNEAYTTLTALRRMGIDVARVERSDIFVADVADDRAEELDAVMRTLETLYNPNKHRLNVRDAAAPAAGEVWIAPLAESAETPGAIVVAGRTLPGTRALLRRTAWRLFDARERYVSDTIRDAAVAGLLCNPAFQLALRP
jgi:hypothetical protein